MDSETVLVAKFRNYQKNEPAPRGAGRVISELLRRVVVTLLGSFGWFAPGQRFLPVA